MNEAKWIEMSQTFTRSILWYNPVQFADIVLCLTDIICNTRHSAYGKIDLS